MSDDYAIEIDEQTLATNVWRQQMFPEQDIGEVTPEKLHELMRAIIDPELGENLVDLGLIYGIDMEDSAVTIRMTLTTPGCPYAEEIIMQVLTLCRSVNGINRADVDLVWEPPWSPAKMTEDARLKLGFDV